MDHMQDWARIKEIVADALPLKGDARSAYLAQQYAKSPALRGDIEALLAMSTGDEANGFLANPAVLPDAPFVPEATRAGELVGAWRLVAEIGRGGMGVVYLAERDDGAYRQQAAVKLLSGAGRVSDPAAQAIARERQALATLNHPNVARLLDGGTTAEGLPYLVMEFVEGVAIDTYCKGRALSLRGRVALVRGVCSAVQAAHQNLLIHRDIKPSNIIVTQTGDPKLLDFGIARLIDNNITGRNDGARTDSATPQFTPRYASPEQATGKPVSVATDVYGLGLLLYDLLAGASPYARVAAVQFTTAAQAIEAVLNDPIRLASTVARSAEGIGEPYALALTGDLDAILFKACAKQAADRYATVRDLDADLGRWLDKRPITARHHTLLYRAALMARRHWIAVPATAMAVLAITAGMIGTVIQKREAETRYAQARKVTNAFIFKYHDEILNLPGSRPVRVKLIDDGLKFLDEMGTGRGDIDVLVDQASAYRKLSESLFNGFDEPSVGDRARAELEANKAALAITHALKLNPTHVGALTEETLLNVSRAAILWKDGKRDESLPMYERAFAASEQLLLRDPKRRDLGYHQAYIALQIAVARNTPTEPLETTLKAALAAVERWELNHVGDRDFDLPRRLLMARKVTLAADQKEFAAAAQYAADAIAFIEGQTNVSGLSSLAQTPMLQSLYNNRTALTYRLGQYEIARESAERSIALANATLLTDPDSKNMRVIVARGQFHLGRALFQLGKHAEATAQLYRASDAYRQVALENLTGLNTAHRVETLCWWRKASVATKANAAADEALGALRELGKAEACQGL